MTSLDMFENLSNGIKSIVLHHKRYDMSGHVCRMILSYCSFGQVWTCLDKWVSRLTGNDTIVSNCIIVIYSSFIEFRHVVVLDKFGQVWTSLDKFEIVSNRIIYCIMLCNRNIINKSDYLYHFISALSKFEEASDSEKFKKPKIFLKGHQHW